VNCSNTRAASASLPTCTVPRARSQAARRPGGELGAGLWKAYARRATAGKRGGSPKTVAKACWRSSTPGCRRRDSSRAARAAPGLGVVRVLGQDLVHGAQGGLVLAGGVLLEGLVDLDVDRLAAPLEFLAAAARAGGVGFAGHGGLLFVKAPARGHPDLGNRPG